MRRLVWVFAVLMWRRDSARILAHFFQLFSTDSEIQIRLRECAGSYGYLMLSCGVGRAAMFRCTLLKNKQRIPDQDAHGHMDIH